MYGLLQQLGGHVVYLNVLKNYVIYIIYSDFHSGS